MCGISSFSKLRSQAFKFLSSFFLPFCIIYSRKRRGRPGDDVASRCAKVSPPHFLVAVSTPVIMDPVMSQPPSMHHPVCGLFIYKDTDLVMYTTILHLHYLERKWTEEQAIDLKYPSSICYDGLPVNVAVERLEVGGS